MRLKRAEKIFAALCALVLAAALIFVFVGSRITLPMVEEHVFEIPIHYTRNGVPETETVTFECYYLRDGGWTGYYRESGDAEYVTMEATEKGTWLFGLELEPGYLMGDPQYADYYADGLPAPGILYYDVEGNEYPLSMEAEAFDITLIGCDLPEPLVGNDYVDGGVVIDWMQCAVLTAMACIPLLLSLVLIRKKEGVVYDSVDKVSGVLNVILGAAGVPLLTLLCLEWDFVPETVMELIRLIPAITALGICASVILRRKGKAKTALYIQFIGPILFFAVFMLYMVVGMTGYWFNYLIALIVGVLIARRAKPAEGLVPSKLDRFTMVCNFLLIPVYFIFTLPLLFFGAILSIDSDMGILMHIVGRLIALVIAASPIYCGAALGLSAAYRKKGRSRAAFLMQFAGFAAIVLMYIFTIAVDLLPGVSITIN